jgi:RNA polymerase sigma-70 factor (ECF subfamily)
MDEALTGPDERTLPGADSLRTEEWICAEYQELGPGLRRYLVRLLGDPGLAEDIVQDVFLRLYEAVQQDRRIANLRSWAFQVGHNLAVDLQRRRGVEGWAMKVVYEEARRDGAPNAEMALLQAERHRLVQAALSLLSPQERQVLELRAEGLRYREIAGLMGLQVSTVATFLLRAVRKIARQIHG